MAASQSYRIDGASEPRWRTAVTHVLSACVFAAFFLYYGLGSFRWGWGGDFQMYCAGVSRLYTSFLHPLHEAMDVPGTQSTVYTPYLIGVAALGRLARLTPYHALQVAGAFNIGAFAAGVAYFTSRHSLHGQWRLPAACFLLTTLCLRWLRFGWSSETSLTNLQYLQAYPSTLAWALAFSAFALTRDLQVSENRASRRRLVALLALLFAFLLLTHLLTASWVIGIVCLYGLVESVRRRSCLPLGQISIALLLALPLIALWPYAPFFSQTSLRKLEEGSVFGSQPWK
ncbi:MAG TPA: hypothetical protein VG963_33840, partial [Polyangiaceae bacterium]|nr:hypothetical protein [Polyangiaceae bacterium]